MPNETDDTVKTERITRSDIRKATIRGFERVKKDPKHVRLTPGQARSIKSRLAAKAS